MFLMFLVFEGLEAKRKRSLDQGKIYAMRSKFVRK